MHIHEIQKWQHSHNFSVEQNQGEIRTKIVLIITAITMIGEIFAGVIFGSMALLADGWHMMTHVAAFAITLFAYQYARNHANDPKYTFGTGKVSILGGFTSAVVLGVVALIMIVESLIRFIQPQVIHFNEAIYVAVIGLVINLISALLLNSDHDHDHHHHDHDRHDHNHDHHHHNHAPQDYNLRAAYVHILADALTSVLAIFALLTGKFLGWIWMDAIMGLVGAFVITKWSYGLMTQTGLILLDGGIDKQQKLNIINAIENDADNRVIDLHVWNLSQSHIAVIISLVTHYPQQPEYYKNLLKHLSSLSHVIVEVNQCHGESCLKCDRT